MPKKQAKETIYQQQPELVPDGPFHGKWQLLVGVSFIDDDGKEVRIAAGEIEGSDLPEVFANDLLERGQLKKDK